MSASACPYRAAHCADRLGWDTTLAAMAQAHADGCADGDSAAAAAGSVGESVAQGPLYASAAAVVDAWYAEKASYRYYGEEPGADALA